jgi:hypothetical protein
MSIEAVAAMLGHKSMRMTLVYARIADRTVVDINHPGPYAISHKGRTRSLRWSAGAGLCGGDI